MARLSFVQSPQLCTLLSYPQNIYWSDSRNLSIGRNSFIISFLCCLGNLLGLLCSPAFRIVCMLTATPQVTQARFDAFCCKSKTGPAVAPCRRISWTTLSRKCCTNLLPGALWNCCQPRLSTPLPQTQCLSRSCLLLDSPRPPGQSYSSYCPWFLSVPSNCQKVFKNWQKMKRQCFIDFEFFTFLFKAFWTCQNTVNFCYLQIQR